jgi:hypothetical protein
MSRRAEPRISTRRDDLLAFPTGERPPAVPSNPHYTDHSCRFFQ